MEFGAGPLPRSTVKFINLVPYRNQVDKRKWLQFCSYAVASLIGLYLDLHVPEVKSLICTPFQGAILDRQQPETERVK